MKTIAILTTGGTIAMARQEAAGGAVPTLHAGDFLTHMGNDLPPLLVEEVCNLPSAHLTLDDLEQIRAHAVNLIRERDVAGVVITHGTDTLEETAFYLDITTDLPEPIVLTGAMRTSSEIGYEGYANIAHAVRVAGSDAARERGVLVVLNNEIHAARWVTKTHTLALDTFKSPYYGPIGRVDAPEVTFISPAGRRPALNSGRLEPNVIALKTGVGSSPLLLNYLLERGSRGIIIEGMGGGRVPPDWLEPIRQGVAQGATIVVSTRCHAGRLVDGYGYRAAHRDLEAAGCLFADGLNTAKCRVKLMAILSQADEPGTIRELWQRL
jgi:L-asparaginase